MEQRAQFQEKLVLPRREDSVAEDHYDQVAARIEPDGCSGDPRVSEGVFRQPFSAAGLSQIRLHEEIAPVTTRAAELPRGECAGHFGRSERSLSSTQSFP